MLRLYLATKELSVRDDHVHSSDDDSNDTLPDITFIGSPTAEKIQHPPTSVKPIWQIHPLHVPVSLCLHQKTPTSVTAKQTYVAGRMTMMMSTFNQPFCSQLLKTGKLCHRKSVKCTFVDAIVVFKPADK